MKLTGSMKMPNIITHTEYEYIVWRLSKTLKKLGYPIESPLKASYSVFATRYGINGRR